MDLATRIKLVRKALDKTQEELAELLDISLSAVQTYESGRQVPGGKVFESLARMGYNVNWLFTGEGPMAIGDLAVSVKAPEEPYQRRSDDQYEYIPLYDVSASAGHGAVVDQELVVDSLAFKADWVRTTLGAAPKDLYLIKVEGESMEPTLRPGDVILVDHRAAATLPRDGIYVLRMDSTLLVKRLQRLPGGVVRVTSDNPAYEPFSLQPGDTDDDLAIVGRVVWCGRRM